MGALPKTERNTAIAAAYKAGVTMRELGERHSLCISRIGRIIRREQKRAQGGPPRAPGRPSIWPECPEYLRERYIKMRRDVGSAEARRRLEKFDQLRSAVVRDQPFAALQA